MQLGDQSLLQIGMGEASELFDIETPIGPRDRKSGAKKRTQAEIEQARLAAAATNG